MASGSEFTQKRFRIAASQGSLDIVTYFNKTNNGVVASRKTSGARTRADCACKAIADTSP